MTTLKSYDRERIYIKLADMHMPWGGNLLVLWSSQPLPAEVPGQKLLGDPAERDTHNALIKSWVCKRTRHSPGKSTSFKDLYRSYCLSTLCKGLDIINESRFSKLVVEAYKEKGFKVQRRRTENRIRFTDLSLLQRPSPFLLICGGRS